MRNSLPIAPVIVDPPANADTYDTTPRLVIDVTQDPDKQALSICIAVDSGDYVVCGSVNGGVTAEIPTQYINQVSTGQHTLKVCLRDTLGAESTAATVTINVLAPSWARTISSGSVIANGSISHQQEILQLYQQVNNILGYYGMDALTVPSLVGSSTPSSGAGKIGMFAAWGSQMLELQNALQGVFNLLSIDPVTFTKASAGMIPKAAIIQEIRTAISAL